MGEVKYVYRKFLPFKQNTTRLIWQNYRDITLILIQELCKNRSDIYFQLIQEITWTHNMTTPDRRSATNHQCAAAMLRMTFLIHLLSLSQ